MNEPVDDFLVQCKAGLQRIKTDAPDVARAFGGFHQSLMKAGSLSVREKELIALAIGMAQGCTHCIYLHAEGSLKAGATREQVIEAAGVAVMMQGGPAFVRLPEVLEALEKIDAA